MNNLKQLIPPGFSERATSSNMAEAYNLNIPLMYTNKNPSWQQLTINEADVLEPEVMMDRMPQENIFAAQNEDVLLLEHEVNQYRLQMNDDELDGLRYEREMLMRQLNDMPQDDFDDQLHDLDAKIRVRQNEVSENQRRMLEMQQENDRLERELAVQPTVASIVHSQPLPQPKPVAIMRSSPPPPQPVVRTVVDTMPRSRSPARNILPTKIANLPIQQETRHGYNYNPAQEATLRTSESGVRGPILSYSGTNFSNEPGDFPDYGSTIQHRETYTMPQSQYTSSPMQMARVSQPGVVMGQPLGPGGVYTSSHSTYTSTVLQPSQSIRPAGPSGLQPSAGRTYRINGVTYTDANLPQQYAYLRQ